MQSIEQRLSRLEGSLRRWKQVSCCLALGLVGILAMAAAKNGSPETINARRINILGNKGEPVVELVAKDDGGVIHVRNAANRANVAIMAHERKCEVSLTQGNSEQVQIGTSKEKGYIRIMDDKGKEVFQK